MKQVFTKGVAIATANNEKGKILETKKIDKKYRLTIKDFYGRSEACIYTDHGEICDELRILRVNSDTLRIRWISKKKTVFDETIPYKLDCGITSYDKNRKYQVIKRELISDSHDLLIEMENGAKKWILSSDIRV